MDNMGFIDDWKEWSTTKKVISIVIVCCVAVLIVAAVGGMLSPDANTSTTDASTNTTTEEQSYGDGTYKVGTDIPAGEYKFTQTSPITGYIERSSDSSMEFESIISNDATTEEGQTTYVTINEGEYLKVQGGELTPA